MKPLNLLVRQQSAKGLHVHLLVKGVAFMEPPGAMDDAVPARPIPLNAHILDGGLSADGLTPTASIGRIKIRFGPGGDCRIKQDIWYPPAHVSEDRARTGAASAGAGSASGATWASRRTERRADMRRTKAAQGRADRILSRRHGEAGSGNESDESAASARRRMGMVRFSGGPGTSDTYSALAPPTSRWDEMTDDEDEGEAGAAHPGGDFR